MPSKNHIKHPQPRLIFDFRCQCTQTNKNSPHAMPPLAFPLWCCIASCPKNKKLECRTIFSMIFLGPQLRKIWEAKFRHQVIEKNDHFEDEGKSPAIGGVSGNTLVTGRNDYNFH